MSKEEIKNGRYVDENRNIKFYKDGLLHREDGPAIYQIEGKQWFKDGLRHREDGPAIEWCDEEKEFYLYGIEYTEEEFNQWIAKKQFNEKLENKLEEKPISKKVKI